MSHDMTPERIKEIRKKYGLTQQSFARVLGLGEASVARYEKGQVPSKANANLIRAADDPSFMLDCLKRDGELISQEQYEKAERIVYAMVTFDEKGEVMDINDIYEITLQQEILNEQAAEYLSELYHLGLEAERKGDALLQMVYDDVAAQIARIKPQIVYEENSNTVKLSEIRGVITGLMRHARAISAKAA